MVETFAELEARPKFHSCNIQAVANIMQVRTERSSIEHSRRLSLNEDSLPREVIMYMLAYANAGGIQEPQLPPVNGMPQAGPVTEAAQRLARDYKIEI
ncbi:hypothetical protein OSTOST_21441 [Ostertagia ostertagi]